MPVNSKKCKLAIIGIIAVTLTMPAFVNAQNGNNNADAALKSSLYQCYSNSSVLERLDCYDKVVARLQISENSGAQNFVPDNSPANLPVKTTAKPKENVSVVGNLARDFGFDKKTDEKTEINATIEKYDRGLTPKVYLDNGEIWQVTDMEDSTIDVKLPAKGKIEKGGLGSYFLTFDGRRNNYRVKRLK